MRDFGVVISGSYLESRLINYISGGVQTLKGDTPENDFIILEYIKYNKTHVIITNEYITTGEVMCVYIKDILITEKIALVLNEEFGTKFVIGSYRVYVVDEIHTTAKYIESLKCRNIYITSNSRDILCALTESSRNMYEMQYSKFKDDKFNSVRTLFKLIRDYIGMSGIEPCRFILCSSSILAAYGLRIMRDIDLYIDNDDGLLTDNEYINKIFMNNDKCNIDVSMKFTDRWADYRDDSNDRWAKRAGANDFNEILYNPRFHFYFMGLKFMNLDVDICKRLIRQTPKAFADILMCNKLLEMNIKIPHIPLTKVNRDTSEIEEINRDTFINSIVYYLRSLYGMNYTNVEINKMIPVEKIMHIRIKKQK